MRDTDGCTLGGEATTGVRLRIGPLAQIDSFVHFLPMIEDSRTYKFDLHDKCPCLQYKFPPVGCFIVYGHN